MNLETRNASIVGQPGNATGAPVVWPSSPNSVRPGTAVRRPRNANTALILGLLAVSGAVTHIETPAIRISSQVGLSVATAADEAKPGEGRFVRLFDGKTLAGWTGAKDAYGVENGAIVCKPGTSGNLLTEKEYGDFVFRFEFKLTEGANNGLGIRCPLRPQGNLHLDGIELQILDHRAAKYANIKPYQFHGSVYGIAPAKKEFLKPLGEWNQQEVTVRGRRIQISLNGAAIVDVDLDEATKNGTLDGAEHPGLKRVRGHIGFLGHGDRVEFRAIEIKEL